jgi:hypothetical protein
MRTAHAQARAERDQCYLGDVSDMREPDENVDDRDVERARMLTRLLDDAVRIPGTDFRIGLDPVIGLVPGAGDLVTGAMSAYLLVVARRAGASNAVLLRMLANLGIDALVGAVPLLGDLFDAGYKANRRNMRIIEEHLARPAATRRASRGVAALVLLLAVGVTVGTIALAVVLVRLLVAAF